LCSNIVRREVNVRPERRIVHQLRKSNVIHSGKLRVSQMNGITRVLSLMIGQLFFFKPFLFF
jgi:hypothetical protein